MKTFRITKFQMLFIFFTYRILMWSTTATFAHAKDYTFSWTANPEPVTGYKLYYKKGGTAAPPFNGTDSPLGPSPITVGKKTTFTITGLQDNTTYHFALTAYEGTNESEFSQVLTVLPDASPSPPQIPAPTILDIKKNDRQGLSVSRHSGVKKLSFPRLPLYTYRFISCSAFLILLIVYRSNLENSHLGYLLLLLSVTG